MCMRNNEMLGRSIKLCSENFDRTGSVRPIEKYTKFS